MPKVNCPQIYTALKEYGFPIKMNSEKMCTIQGSTFKAYCNCFHMQRLQEKQHEWEEKQREWGKRVEKLQKEREVELQGKKKEIHDLKSKVKELEKAAALLGRVQQHSKGQSLQLLQLQDEAKVKEVYEHVQFCNVLISLNVIVGKGYRSG